MKPEGDSFTANKKLFRKQSFGIRLRKDFRRDWQLIILCLLPIAYFIIFHYIPMYGVQIAFKKFRPADGIWNSEFVGFQQFERFFSSYQFKPIIWNTISLSLLQVAIAFPVPILLAILLNQVRAQRFRKFVQSLVYFPHFISIVVLAGMLYIFLSPRNGIVNNIITALGGEAIFFLGDPKYFKLTFVISGIWQNAGWNAIIYIAALAAINPDLYDAAQVDGANKWQLVWHIDLPGILPTIVMMLILEMGRIMNIGFQKAYLLQNARNLAASEVISTYIYKVGLIDMQYSYSAAINLFNNLVNIALLLTVNWISKKITDYGIL